MAVPKVTPPRDVGGVLQTFPSHASPMSKASDFAHAFAAAARHPSLNALFNTFPTALRGIASMQRSALSRPSSSSKRK